MPSSWTPADPSHPALTFTYSFGSGTAKALALPVEGGWAVVSPPCNAEGSMAELEARGPVRAIVAPNAFHTMGVAPWKARFPDAQVFAPAQSIGRVTKQSKVAGIRPLSEMASVAGDRFELVDMPHYKTGEALVRWRIEGGWAWYITDVAMNLTEPLKGVFGMIFRWTKSTPGFRRNAIAGRFMVKDRRSLYGWLAEQAEKTPPKLLVMCHGDSIRPADPVAEVRAALA